MRKGNKKTKSTKAIKAATKRLLIKKKDINQITVVDISREANINRGTFYNHYENVHDVIDEIEDDLLNHFLKSWQKAQLSNTFAETLMNNLTASMKNRQEEYKELVKYIPQYIFVDLKNKIVKEITTDYLKKNPVDQETRAGLFILANGIASCYVDYFQRKLYVNLDELSKTSIRLIKRFLYKPYLQAGLDSNDYL